MQRIVEVNGWDTIRIMLDVVVKSEWVVYQLDVKSAFLYGELKETIYVEQLEWPVQVRNPDKVYRLKKALYRLKQAPHVWHSTIKTYFE